MKKRLISILLTVLMVMSMFTGMSVSAYADDVIDSSYYKEYTLAEGDYVLRICQRMGINYYTCKEAIMRLNNIASENGFRYLSVGQTVKIPVSDSAAVAIMTGKPAGGTTGSGSNTTTGTSGVDSVAYYLVPYTMQRGETVLGVCNSMGINFTKNADLIQSVNGIKSWNSVKAGATILLPTTKTPAVGTTCYAVAAHKIVSGETTYTICQNKGINYGSSTKLLQAVNPKTNLSAIKAGATLYLPIATTIKASTSGSTNTGNNNTGNTTDKNNTSTAAKTFDINANINTNYGTMKFYVNNKAVNAAAEGDVVTIDVATKDNKAVESLIVKFSDGRADVKLEANSFIMPGCDVRVDANINAGYNIDISSNYSYKTAATVGGVSVSSAADGSSVKIVSTDPGYAVKEVEAYYSTMMGIKKNVLTVNDQFCFVMPKKDVSVDVTLAPVDTYDFYRADTFDGSFDIQIDGFSVSKAAKGAKVTVLWQAMSGYEIGSIYVCKADKAGNPIAGGEINVFNNSFTMPASPVYINVSFEPAVNSIDLEAVEGGIIYAEVNGENASEANTGDTVNIYAVAKQSGYTNTIKELVVTRKADGHRVSVAGDSFLMPAGGVIVSAKLESATNNTVTVKFNATGSENRVTLKAEGVENWSVIDNDSGASNNYAVGTRINLSTLERDTYAFSRYEVKVDGVFDQEMTDIANAENLIVMPDANVEIKAFFSAGNIKIGEAKITKGDGIVSYQVSTDGTKFNSAHSCKVGNYVQIVAVSKDPNLFALKSNIKVVNKQTGNELALVDSNNDGKFEFQMPPEGVEISVAFTGKAHTVTFKTSPADLKGDSLCSLKVNSGDAVIENTGDTTINVKSGDTLTIALTSLGKENYNISKIEVEGTKGEKYSGGLQYNQNKGVYTMAMVDDDLKITVILSSKTSSTCSLTEIEYNNSKAGTAGCTTDGINGIVVDSCKVGDIVYVVPKTLDPYGVSASSLVVTRKSDNGVFTRGATNAEDSAMVDGEYYPITNSNGAVVGWKYIMPSGGAKMKINFTTGQYTANLSVVDTKGVNLLTNGYVYLDVGNGLVDVTGSVEDIKYNTSVTVKLTNAGSSLYTIKSVTVPGVEVSKKFSFSMPASDAAVNVVLEPKKGVVSVAEVTVSASAVNGTVKLYEDAEFKTPLGNTAKVGSKVYMKLTPNAGYEFEKVEGVTATGNVFTVPKTNTNVTVSFVPVKIALSAETSYCTVKFFSDAAMTTEITGKADGGSTVYVELAANTAGYELEDIKAESNGKAVSLTKIDTNKYSFVAPAKDVKVTASFIGAEVELATDAANGTVKFYSDKELKNELKADPRVGDTVYFTVEAAAGYTMKTDSVKAKTNEDNDVTVTKDGDKYSIKVPANATKVTVKAEFTANEVKLNDHMKVTGGSVLFYSKEAVDNECLIWDAKVGDTVYVMAFENPNPVSSFKITDAANNDIKTFVSDKSSNGLGQLYKFVVPGGDFEVNVVIG